MARGKVQMRRIENPVHRQVTFCKRRTGLLKKARELSVLCGADIGIIIVSGQGKLYELATNGNMEGLIEKYKGASGEDHLNGGELNQTQESEEALMIKQEISLVQKGLRFLYGDKATEHMTLEEMHVLERNLEVWMYKFRSVKMKMMLQEIQSLKNKEGILKAANEILQEKIVEQNGLFDVAQFAAHQEGYFSEAPAAHVIPNYATNPLTLDDYGNFIFRGGSQMGFSY
ncbi:hypothetical protein LUZ63_003560 [Rhynchospora breviuscula]|uniref:MADS-box transcription factor n=1 Tax=Rhynchospora breviuscula TaxID=2022672 RepID=A0A9Q0HZ35_9POAL|nr:hypothetical protein LUZ63_003560 [Rhynchospora breviuscula]